MLIPNEHYCLITGLLQAKSYDLRSLVAGGLT